MLIKQEKRLREKNLLDNLEFDGNTKLCILIGNPVSHSLSPRMHTTAFNEIDFNCVYLACKVEKKDLKNAANAIKALGMVGANVTIPHKIDIMEYLDEIDPIAKDIGAINTIVNRDGSLYATNTDGKGAIRSLREAGIDLEARTTTMIGAGGVARPISFFLLQEIDHLYLTDINMDAANNLKKDLIERYPNKITLFESNDKNLKKVLEKSEILFNCTPVGMHPNIKDTPVPKAFLRDDLSVFDVVYNPLKTQLIKDAIDVGAKAVGGIKMFLYQGVEAFELWTSKKAPVKLMEKIIIEKLSSPK
ncbi:MAG: shikimate dehydrogenase [Candidatus Lokiarchaeota archaeon]|nr:shikimate dehydrogenase [Candidatus Lokiarchaeota archaeon]